MRTTCVATVELIASRTARYASIVRSRNASPFETRALHTTADTSVASSPIATDISMPLAVRKMRLALPTSAPIHAGAASALAVKPLLRFAIDSVPITIGLYLTMNRHDWQAHART